TDGDLDFEIVPIAAVAIAAFAVPTTFSAERVVVSKLQKRVFVDICYEIDIAAATAISAAGPAARNKLLPAEGNATMPAVACFHRDFGFVDEHKGRQKPLYSGPSLWLCVCVVLFDRLNRNESSRYAFIFKLNNPGNLCEERIVLADTNIQAWFEFRAALTNQYRSPGQELAGKPLHPEPLGVAVAAVA